MIEHLRLYLVSLRNILLGMNLMALRWIARPRKLVNLVSILLFYQGTLAGSRKLRQQNPFDRPGSPTLFRIDLDTRSHIWDADPSYVKDLLVLCQLIRMLDARAIFEIGTLKGYGTLHIAMNSAPDAKVYSLDLPKGGGPSPLLRTTVLDQKHQRGHARMQAYDFEGTPFEQKVSLLFGDSATFDFSPYRNAIDLFFIDGAHSYEYVRSDTLHALECVRSGGVIVWHDYGRYGLNGVSRWLHEFAAEHEGVFAVPGSSIAYYFIP